RTVFGLAGLLESQAANPYRVRAYRRAAVGLLRFPVDASTCTTMDAQLALPWLGPRLRRKLGELVSTGRMQFREELLASLSPPFRELLTVPGLCPKTAERLIRESNINGLADLAAAAQRGDLRKLRGIGPDRERRFGEAAE